MSSSRDRGDGIVRGPHLCQDFVQPLKWSIEMDFDPARCAGDILAMVLRSPTLHEAHSDRAHLGEFINSLKSMVDRLGEKSRKLLVVEDLQAASRRYLADGGRMEAVAVITVAALDKDAAVAQALCVYFTSDVVQVDTCKKRKVERFHAKEVV